MGSLARLADDGNAEALRRALDAYPGINLDAVSSRSGGTALGTACRRGHVAFARALLERGADPNKKDAGGSPPLLYAVARRHADCVRLLLDRGADPDARQNERAHTALIRADGMGGVDIARLLLHSGADPNALMANGRTALMSAARTGNVNMVRLLLAFGADPAARDIWDRTARTFATEQLQTDVDAVLAVTEGWTVLRVAVACRHHAAARAVLRLGRVDTAGCDAAKLLALAVSTAPLGPGCPAAEVCPSTVAAVRLAMRPWSPANHAIYHRRFRDRIRTVMLITWRLDAAPLPLLPKLERESWRLVCSFLARGDWPVR